MKVGKTVKTKEADYALEGVNKLAQVIPEIWDNGMDGDDESMIKRTKSDLDAFLTTAAVGA